VSIRDVLGIAFHFEKMLYDNAVPLLAERAHVYLGGLPVTPELC
jgi:hypothetical protein